MDLVSRMIWRFGHQIKLDTSSFSVKSQSAILHFFHLTTFVEETKAFNFSVKTSWRVRWIMMLQKDLVRVRYALHILSHIYFELMIVPFTYSVMHKKPDKSILKNFIYKKFKKQLYFLPAFYLVMWLMNVQKIFGKKVILKI